MAYLYIMNQSFIEVEHEAILLAFLDRAQERRVNFGQVGKVIGELNLRVASDCRGFKDCKRVFTGQTRLPIVATLAGISRGPVNAASRLGASSVHRSAIRIIATCTAANLIGNLVVFHLNFGELKCIGSELFNAVQNVADSVNGHARNLVHPVVDNFENLFVLVGASDVADNVFLVRSVDFEESRGVGLSFDFFGCFLCNSFSNFGFPGRAGLIIGAIEYAR